MSKVILSTLLCCGVIHLGCCSNVLKTLDFKVVYSNICHIYQNNAKHSIMYNILDAYPGYSEKFNGYRVFGIGIGLKSSFSKSFFVGVNSSFENINNSYSIITNDSILGVKCSAKNSLKIIPVFGISICNIDIYGGLGISCAKINYRQYCTDEIDTSGEFYNNYQMHNWRGNFTWCVGIDALINNKVFCGLEYTKTRIKFSFIEYPNSDRFKSYFKANNHIVSVTLKYKF